MYQTAEGKGQGEPSHRANGALKIANTGPVGTSDIIPRGDVEPGLQGQPSGMNLSGSGGGGGDGANALKPPAPAHNDFPNLINEGAKGLNVNGNGDVLQPHYLNRRTRSKSLPLNQLQRVASGDAPTQQQNRQQPYPDQPPLESQLLKEVGGLGTQNGYCNITTQEPQHLLLPMHTMLSESPSPNQRRDRSDRGDQESSGRGITPTQRIHQPQSLPGPPLFESQPTKDIAGEDGGPGQPSSAPTQQRPQQAPPGQPLPKPQLPEPRDDVGDGESTRRVEMPMHQEHRQQLSSSLPQTDSRPHERRAKHGDGGLNQRGDMLTQSQHNLSYPPNNSRSEPPPPNETSDEGDPNERGVGGGGSGPPSNVLTRQQHHEQPSLSVSGPESLPSDQGGGGDDERPGRPGYAGVQRHVPFSNQQLFEPLPPNDASGTDNEGLSQQNDTPTQQYLMPSPRQPQQEPPHPDKTGGVDDRESIELGNALAWRHRPTQEQLDSPPPNRSGGRGVPLQPAEMTQQSNAPARVDREQPLPRLPHSEARLPGPRADKIKGDADRRGNALIRDQPLGQTLLFQPPDQGKGNKSGSGRGGGDPSQGAPSGSIPEEPDEQKCCCWC
ncbi:hypothetical protein FRB93_002171 [Tulasnella sp. JGI-2019a]|nr:hypothetical protein FRB93_002171 [Tulasnella sp. JGI-2019a]